MSKFDDWWNNPELNPVHNVPESTQLQIKGFMRAAFNAGKEAWRSNIAAQADAIRAKVKAGHG